MFDTFGIKCSRGELKRRSLDHCTLQLIAPSVWQLGTIFPFVTEWNKFQLTVWSGLISPNRFIRLNKIITHKSIHNTWIFQNFNLPTPLIKIVKSIQFEDKGDWYGKHGSWLQFYILSLKNLLNFKTALSCSSSQTRNSI